MRRSLLRFIIGISAVIAIVVGLGGNAQAVSKFKILHRFHKTDGAYPAGNLTFDAAGNLYGTSGGGDTSCGSGGCGTVYELTPNADGTWSETVLHYFTSTEDNEPAIGVTLDAAGNLYGTTVQGPDAGDVYQLVPQPDGSWTENILHKFGGAYDGNPQGGMAFDASGNLYGTSGWGCGLAGESCVFEMTPTSGGSWTFTALYQFPFSGAAGWYPSGTTPIFDAKGNIYATTAFGGDYGCSPYGNGCYGLGVAFELSPNADGTWTETLLHTFTGGNDGESPTCALVFDARGSLYGTTFSGGEYGNGNVFKLIPNADGTWTERVLHQFTGGKDGSVPFAGLTFDAQGNLYGTTTEGGAFGYGVVFEMKPTGNGGWTYSVLYSFNDTVGARPDAGLILDAAGNLYGTTAGDGKKTFGSVFEITP